MTHLSMSLNTFSDECHNPTYRGAENVKNKRTQAEISEDLTSFRVRLILLERDLDLNFSNQIEVKHTLLQVSQELKEYASAIEVVESTPPTEER